MNAKPTYEELEKRCNSAEAMLKAIRTGEADTVISEQGLLVLRLEKELIETRALYTLSRALNEIGTFENAVQKAADLMAETLQVDRLNIILFDLMAQTILSYARGGPGKERSVEVPFAELQEGLSGWVLQTRQAALSPKTGPDPRESQIVQARRKATHCGAIIVVPILHQKTLLGTLTAINRQDQRDFTQEDVDLLEAIAHQAGVLIRNSQLYADLRQEVQLRQLTQSELEKAYAEQEQRVRERTAELAEKNQALEQEVRERKKAEEKAQANEKVLQLFVQYAPAAIAMFDREMRYIAVSPRFLTDYRLAEQNVVGCSHYEVFPETPSSWKEIHQRCLAGAVEKAEENPFPREDGTLDWVRWEIHPWHETTGAIGGIILFSEVITQRKQAEEALRQSEEKYRSLFEHMLEGYAYCQIIYENEAARDWIYISVNEAFEKLTGLANVTGKRISEVVPGLLESDPGLLEIYGRVASTGQPEKFEIYVEALQLWFSISAYCPKTGCFVAIFDVITERKQAEIALRQSKQRFEALLSQAPFTGVIYRFIYDQAGNVVDWEISDINALGAASINLTVETAIGKRALALFGDEVMAPYFEVARQVAASHQPQTFETYFEVNHHHYLSSVFMVGTDHYANMSIDITDRKRAEEALQERERKLSTILDLLPVGISILDQNAQVVYVNPALESILDIRREGLLRGEFRNRQYLQKDGSNMPREKLASFRALQEQTPVHDIETGVVKEDGRIIWMNVSAVPVDFPDWKVVIVTADITERKRTEAALHESEERLRLALTATHQGLYDLNVQTGDVQVNDEYALMLGYAPEEFHETNADWRKRLHPEDVKPVTQIYEDYISGKAPDYRMEFRQRTRAGSWKWILSLGKLVEWDARGRPLRMLGTHTDITAQKQAEEALRKSEERFRTTFEGMLEGTQIIGFDWRYVYLNATAEKHNRRPNRELLGQRYMDKWPGIEETHIFTLLKSCMETRTAYHVENEFIFPDGEARWYELSIQPVPEGIFILSIDITERKLIEASLRQSEEKYRLLAENISDVIWILDIQTSRFRYISPSVKQLRGYTAEEALAQEMAVSITPASAEYLAQVLPARLEEFSQGITKDYIDEMEQPCKDGRTVWTETTTRFILRAETGQLEVYGVSRDITERKRAEAALRQSEENFSKAFISSPTALLMTRLSDGKIIELNEAYTTIVGYTREELLGRKTIEFNIYLDTKDRQQIVERLLRTGTTRDVELDIRHCSGSIKHVIAAQEIITFNGETCILSSLLDITSRKQLEETLRTTTQRVQLILQSLYGGILVLRNDNRVEFANHAFCELFELQDRPEDLLGLHAQEIIQKITDVYADPPHALARIDEIVAALQPVQDEEIEISKGRTYLRDFIPIEIEGHLHGRMWHHLDITERKRSEAELRTALEELKRSNAELEQFAYVASHDLQEPLRAVAGMVQLLQQRYHGQLDERADEYIRHAVEAAGRMQTLINDLLAFSRVDRHGRVFTPIDSALCLQAALKNLDYSLQESHAHITWEDLPTLTADGMQLIQLFQNLISNGLKFTRNPNPEIHIRAERVKNTWQFSVRDNGIGIDPQYFERIFLIFQRLHTRREYPGTGVGLAICKKIIERHGGQIWVESEPGQGSTFYFTIPIP